MSANAKCRNETGDTDRGLAVTLDYVIGLGIFLVLSTALLSGIFALQEERKDAVEQQEVERVSEKTIVELREILATIELLSNTSTGATTYETSITISDTLPQQTVSIGLNQTSSTDVIVRTQGEDVRFQDTISVTEYNNIAAISVDSVSVTDYITMSYNETGSNEVVIRGD